MVCLIGHDLIKHSGTTWKYKEIMHNCRNKIQALPKRLPRSGLAVLETCVSLGDCERVLFERLRKVKFIGEVELSSADLQKLTNLIATELAPNPKRGLRLLKQKAPASIAAFLVWQGIMEYKEGDYWTPALQAIGLEETRWQQELGKAFIKFLRRMDMPVFPIEGALRFVTPILLHGGIPQKCLDQFFDDVIMDMLEFKLVTGDDITDHLNSLREDEKTRVALEKELEILKEKELDCRKGLEDLASLINLRQQTAKVEETIDASPDWRQIPEDYETYRLEKLRELEDINGQISELQREEQLYRDKVSAFTPQHDAVIQAGPMICAIRPELPQILCDKSELESLLSDEAKCVETLKGYIRDGRDGQSERLFERSSISGLSEFSPVAVGALNAVADVLSELDAVKASTSKVRDEISQMTFEPQEPHDILWVGSASLLAALLIWLIPTYSPLRLGVAAALALLGCFSVILGLRENDRVSTDNKQRKACYDATLEEVLKMQSMIEDCENKLRPLVDTVTSYCKLLKRKRELVESIAKWEHRLDSVLLQVGLPGLKSKADEQSENKRGSEVQNEEESLGETKSFKAKFKIEDLCDEDSLQRAVEPLTSSLDDAIQRSEDSRNAKEHLERCVLPQLSELRTKSADIKAHIEELDSAVARLGNGSFEAGLEELKAKYEVLRRLAKAKVDMSRIRQSIRELMQTIPGLIDAEMDSIDDLLRLRDARRKDLKELELSIEDTESKLQDYPPAYPYTDEPVQRFVIYGEDWAKKWITGAVEMLELTREKGDIPEGCMSGLPSRVVQGFREWWESRKTVPEHERFSHEASRDRLPAPKIMLDSINGDIKIVIDSLRFRLEQADNVRSASLVLTSSAYPGWSKTIPLELRRTRIPGLVETDAVEYALQILDEVCQEAASTHEGYDSSSVSPIATCLPGLAKSYEVSLVIGDHRQKTWSVEVFDDASPCLIFHEDGKLIESRRLPRARVWFVLPSGWGFTKMLRIVEDATPPYLLDACRIYLIDLALLDSDKLVVGDGSGKEFEFRIESSRLSEPRLEGGRLIPGVLIDGNPLYIGGPPCLEIPFSDDRRTDTWDVLIRYGDEPLSESKRFTLRESLQMTGVVAQDDRIRIDLKLPGLLGPDPIGQYTVYVRQKDRRRLKASFTFTVVPDFSYAFEPSVVFPVEDDSSEVKLLVSTFEGAKFSVFSPARILSGEENDYRFLVKPSEDTVAGKLSFASSDGRFLELPVRIDVPKVKWCLRERMEERGTDWSGNVQDVFIGDLSSSQQLVLQLDVPRDVTEVRLSLGDKQTARRPVKDGKAQIDLMQFMDTLRAGGSVGEISGQAFDASGKVVGEGAILRLRWRWEVIGFSCEKKNRFGVWHLEFKWKEEGRVQNRVLRMWRMDKPWQPPVEWRIPSGQTHLGLTADEGRLPQGAYLVQFDTFDKWSSASQEPRFPSDECNTFIVHLYREAPYIENWSVRWNHESRADSGYAAEITGSAVNVSPGTKVKAILLGIRQGMACCWKGHAVVDSAGRFMIRIQDEREDEKTQANERRARRQDDVKKRYTIKNSARWIGIVVESDPVTHLFAILPEPAQVEWWFAPKSPSPAHLEWPYLRQARKAFIVQRASELPGLLMDTLRVDFPIPERNPIVRIRCEEGSLDHPDLSDEDSKRVIKAWLEDDESVDVSVLIGTEKDKTTIRWTSSRESLQIALKTGRVYCSACNKLVEDQATWDKHHYPKCKTLYPKKQVVKASLLLVDEPMTDLFCRFKAYALSGNYPLTLHAKPSHGRLPIELLTGDDIDSLTKLTRLLVSLEEELVSALSGSESINEHESH